MAKQHYSISNHTSSSDVESNISIHQNQDLDSNSDSDTIPTLTYPASPPSTPTTQIFNTQIPSATPSTPSASPNLSPGSEPDDDIIISLPTTLTLTNNIIAALSTYITKLRADLYADPPRVPAIAIYEIRCAERYQAILKMKACRMEMINAKLERCIAEHADTEQIVRKWWRGQDGREDVEGWEKELEYIRQARRYLISSHVFYKINYELVK